MEIRMFLNTEIIMKGKNQIGEIMLPDFESLYK